MKYPSLLSLSAAVALTAMACESDDDTSARVSVEPSSEDDSGAEQPDERDAGTLPDVEPDAGDASKKVVASILGELFAPLAGFEATTAKGAALAIVSVAGKTTISVGFSGLAADTAYTGHVHDMPCADNAGAHYLLDAATPAGEANEIWVKVMTDAAGHGRYAIEVPHVLRADAKSVVLHDTSGAKMLCADLVGGVPFVVSGSATGLPAAALAGVPSVNADATLTRSEDGTTKAELQVTALAPSTMYMSHVHEEACATTPPGGAHYKRDYSVTDTVEANEIFLNFTTDASGAGAASHVIDVSADATARSVVIHAMDETKTRLVCIDLVNE